MRAVEEYLSLYNDTLYISNLVPLSSAGSSNLCGIHVATSNPLIRGAGSLVVQCRTFRCL